MTARTGNTPITYAADALAKFKVANGIWLISVKEILR